MCTWCGHPEHGVHCPRDIQVSSGPSEGRKVVNRRIGCPCQRNAE